MRFLVFIFATVLFIQGQLKAETATGLQYFQKLDAEDYDITLLTVDRGPQFYALGGHSLFRIRENSKSLPYDIAVNWGVFDFRAPNFFQNAIFGRLNYRALVQSMGSVYWLYNVEKRDIFENRLYLTNLQKKKLLDRLQWWTQPENSLYRYDLFFKNCSTILRDELAATLGPEFKISLEQQKKPTFREAYAKYFYPYPFSILAPIFMTSVTDQPISQWEHFIMPVELPHILKEIKAFDDSGKMQQNKLLGPTTRIFSGGSYPLPKSDTYSFIVLASLLSLSFLALVCFKWGPLFLTHRVLGLNLFVLSTISFVFSLVMTFLWSFTEYTYTYHNALLWFFWPTDIIYVVISLKLLFFNQTPQKRSSLRNLAIFFMKAHLIALIIQTSLWVTGFIQQDLSIFYIYLLAPYLFLAFLCQRYVFKS